MHPISLSIKDEDRLVALTSRPKFIQKAKVHSVLK